MSRVDHLRAAARCYARAGREDDALRCSVDAGDLGSAARLHERAGRFTAAAEAHAAAGQPREAARCWEAADAPRPAALAWAAAGEPLRAAWLHAHHLAEPAAAAALLADHAGTDLLALHAAEVVRLRLRPAAPGAMLRLAETWRAVSELPTTGDRTRVLAWCVSVARAGGRPDLVLRMYASQSDAAAWERQTAELLGQPLRPLDPETR